MMKRHGVLSLVAAAPAVAALISCGASAQSVGHSNLTVRCTETRTAQDLGVVGTGSCVLTGVVHDNGRAIDYRTLFGGNALIRRVITGSKGTITFTITIPLNGGSEPWTITSGTRAYANLHGNGYEVVDNYSGTPATFVLKGNVSQGGSRQSP